jgi:xanthine dehydrogenase molybdenum-binding subunit
MTTVERPSYSVIGTRPVRPDGVEKVTGKAQYGADIRLPGLIHGRILRSPHAHARIVSVDTSEAEAAGRPGGGHCEGSSGRERQARRPG